jgi:hypothetical protein
MGIELLGGRILAPFFGSSIHIWGSIITVFMVSLSIGYLLGGKLSIHSASLKRYGVIFIIAGITILPITFWATAIMSSIFSLIEDSRYGSLMASVVLFFIPTLFLGMLSPYAVRLLTTHHEKSGNIAGNLYFVSTLGSALGTIFTSFYLVLWFDINHIIWGFSCVLIALGILPLLITTTLSPSSVSQQP